MLIGHYRLVFADLHWSDRPLMGETLSEGLQRLQTAGV